MGLLDSWYNREPKKEITKETTQKEGLALFFEVLWREFWELAKLNGLMIVCCLPLVTIPCVLTASARVILLMFLDRPVYTVEDFFATFKKEWKKASIVGLLYFPLLALTLFALNFYSTVYKNFILYTLAMLAVALVLIMGFYLFPMIAIVELKIKEIFHNAFLLTFIRMPQNIATLLALMLLTFLVLGFLPPTILVVILFYFALLVFITNFCAYGGLKRYIIKKEENERD